MMGCSGISWTTCKQSAPRSRQITTTSPQHSIFSGRVLFLTPKQRCQSTEGHNNSNNNGENIKTNKIAIKGDCGARQPLPHSA